MDRSQRQAAEAVARVLEGTTLGEALAAGDDADSPARGFVQELAYGTLRHHGRLEAIARALAHRPITPPALAALVEVALYQLEFARAEPHAVVDRAVDAAAAIAGPGARGLVNAMLRRFLRERETLAALPAAPVARWSHPRWWIARLRADWPDSWESILEAGNARPPMTLRANTRRIARDALAARFVAAGIACEPVGASGLVLAEPRPVHALEGFRDGDFSVQDAGAQLAAPLLGTRDGERVLDACAAPGGKTTHVLELAAPAELVALDVDAARLARVRENLDRLQLAAPGVTCVAADAADPASWWDGHPFDRILADVPCTASGIVRRHPDIKWLRRAGDVDANVPRQATLVDALWGTLKSGGTLLYVTCSVFRAENERQAAAFAARHADALREPLTFPAGSDAVEGQLLPSLPGARHNQDGFFYARFRKA